MKYEKTALRLREALEDANISQQELADKSHIGKSSISHYINGSNEPRNKTAYKLAEVLKVNPAWLMGLDAPKHDPRPNGILIEYAKKLSELPTGKQISAMNYIDFLITEKGDSDVENER